MCHLVILSYSEMGNGQIWSWGYQQMLTERCCTFFFFAIPKTRPKEGGLRRLETSLCYTCCGKVCQLFKLCSNDSSLGPNRDVQDDRAELEKTIRTFCNDMEFHLFF